MHNLWDKNADMPLAADIKALKSKIVTIKPFEPERDGYVFLHGVALAAFKNKLYCSWAHNKVRENSDDEEVNFAVSDDGGNTWSGLIKGDFKSDPSLGAVSHGAFLVHDNALYFFAPRFLGQLGAKMMQTHAYVLDEAMGNFRHLGVVLNHRFWPMCRPILMENGNYIMAGIYVGKNYVSDDNTAAVAISHGNDILSWDIVKLEKENGVKVWGECTVTVRGNVCNMYCRSIRAKGSRFSAKARITEKPGLSLIRAIFP